MRLSRLLPLIVGLSIVLGLMLWLVDSLYRLYLQISFTSPLLATVLLVLLIALLAALIAAFIYYVLLFWRSRSKQSRRQKRSKPKVSEVKTEAAGETLRAVQQQVAQIQDEVSRRALLERSREIEASLTQRELQVVVFGTGSAGKTSLVNALIGRVVGQVSAPMGTTEVGETYRLPLKGLREILITDTPGILEVGVAGTEREQLARQLATEADLLLFVLDDDLRQSEYAPLRSLVQIGKRSLVVFNKTDRYSEADREAILARLQDRVQGLVGVEDVVAIAAQPQPVRLEAGRLFQLDPDILPLIQRMAAVLRAEGEDLVADNILLQSQRLGDEARQLIDVQRRRQAEKVVERFQWISAGVIWITPLPVVDLLATAAVNAQMVVEIGKIYGCELNMSRGRELAISLAKTLAGLGIVRGAIDLISRVVQFTVVGYLAGRAVQSVSAAYLTRIAGKSFIEYFRHDQDWGDGGITQVVQQQFQLNRRDEFIKAFVQEALAKLPEGLGRVMKSLPRNPEAQVVEEDDRL